MAGVEKYIYCSGSRCSLRLQPRPSFHAAGHHSRRRLRHLKRLRASFQLGVLPEMPLLSQCFQPLVDCFFFLLCSDQRVETLRHMEAAENLRSLLQ